MIRVSRDTPLEASLGTTLTRILPGDGVQVLQVSAPGALYLIRDDTLDDGDAVPASSRFPIPAGSILPIPVEGPRILLAAASGTVDASFLGQARPRARGDGAGVGARR